MNNVAKSALCKDLSQHGVVELNDGSTGIFTLRNVLKVFLLCHQYTNF